jgi:hypothetical protein
MAHRRVARALRRPFRGRNEMSDGPPAAQFGAAQQRDGCPTALFSEVEVFASAGAV